MDRRVREAGTGRTGETGSRRDGDRRESGYTGDKGRKRVEERASVKGTGGVKGRSGAKDSGEVKGRSGAKDSGGVKGRRGAKDSGGVKGRSGAKDSGEVKDSGRKMENKYSAKVKRDVSGKEPMERNNSISGRGEWAKGKSAFGLRERNAEKYGSETGTRNGKRETSHVRGDARRGRSLCPVSEQCGGCHLLGMEYAEQLKLKQKQVEDLLKGLCPVKPIIGMKEPFHYRNKVHAVFDRDRRGNIISGIYQENTHNVIPVEECLIEDRKADEIISTIRGMLKSFKLRTYDEDTGYGLLRHVLIRRGFSTGEIMVVLVTASPVFPSKNNFVKALREKHPEITTIVQNINGRGTSMVLGDKEHVLYGKGYIVDELCGCRFRISSKSFYQVNPVQTEVLYAKALELAGLTGGETVVDAYCGIGTIGIIASKKAGRVIGVELNQDAVRDAVSNAKMNEIENIRFYCNDAGRFLVNMAEQGEKADVVIMDPPRSGSTEEFMDSIGKMGVQKVVYVSCNPETLARDVRYMKKLGYRAEVAWGVDLFPFTFHCEVCVEICRK